jgi:CubicO group peptidase (beta-lactamase class C family)
MDEVRVEALIERPGIAAQLCVLRDGEVVFERAVGAEIDQPFLLFSAGKPLTAMLVHRLAGQGLFQLDDPVARYWPEFAEQGKDAITIRQVLQHRAGIPYGKSLPLDAVLAPNWDRSVRALAEARPRFAPGAVPAYHVLSFGFLLGEVVQRATGEPFREVLRREVLEPLGMSRTRLGGPGPSVPMAGWLGVRKVIFNQGFFREAPIPAATVIGTARDLAVFYQAMLDDPASAEARTPSSDGEVDRVLRVPIRWSQGFQLGGPVRGPARHRPMGRGSSPLAFGHNGSNACLGWADPTRRLVVAYLTNRLEGAPAGSPHQAAVSDALLED